MDADKKLVDGMAARVNDRVITVGDVITVMYPEYQKYAGRMDDNKAKERLRQVYKESLDSLISRYLILSSKEAEKVTIPDWFLDQRVEEIIRDNFGGDKSRLLQVLTKDRKTFDEWRGEVKEHIIVATVQSMVVGEAVRVSPVAVRDVYEKNRDKHMTPLQQRLRVIVLKSKPGGVELAKDINDKIHAGENFSDLAKRFSTGLNASEGGDWGWMEPSMLIEDLKNALVDLKAGDVAPAVNAGDEIYIVKVEDRKEPTAAKFDDVQNAIEKELRREEEKRLYSALIERLKKETFVSISDVDPFK
jgi:parvulin-like peptidyl-prolyl isomerase